MKRTTIVTTVLTLMMPLTALVAAAEEDWDERAQPIVQDFARCVKQHEPAAARGYKTTEGAANDVIDACRAHLEKLRSVLQLPPFSYDAAEADANVSTVEVEARGFIIKTIDQLRKGE